MRTIIGANVTIVFRDRANLNDLKVHHLVNANSDIDQMLKNFFNYAENIHGITPKNFVRVVIEPIRD